MQIEILATGRIEKETLEDEVSTERLVKQFVDVVQKKYPNFKFTVRFGPHDDPFLNAHGDRSLIAEYIPSEKQEE